MPIDSPSYYELQDYIKPFVTIVWFYEYLCANEDAVDFLEYPENFKHLDWKRLFCNKNAVRLMERCPYRILYTNISSRWNAMHIIDQYFNEINWIILSRSQDPKAIQLLEKNVDKIDWNFLSSNESAIHILEQNVDKIVWTVLSRNRNAIQLLEQNMDKISWWLLSGNENAVHLLTKNMDKIDWSYLSKNKNAIQLLESNMNKIDWFNLSKNENAIHLLEQHTDRINWYNLSSNKNAIHLLEQNIDKVDINELYDNTNGLQLFIRLISSCTEKKKVLGSGLTRFLETASKEFIFIEKINYKFIDQRMNIFKEELIATSMHPKRLMRHLELGGDIEDF